MSKKNITIDELAIMINNGFEKTSTKDQFLGLEKKVDKLEMRFGKLEGRFDKLEKIILSDYGDRIDKLEMEVKDLKDLLAFK